MTSTMYLSVTDRGTIFAGLVFAFSIFNQFHVGESHATPATQILSPDPCVALSIHFDTFLLRCSFDSLRYISLPAAALIVF